MRTSSERSDSFRRTAIGLAAEHIGGIELCSFRRAVHGFALADQQRRDGRAVRRSYALFASRKVLRDDLRLLPLVRAHSAALRIRAATLSAARYVSRSRFSSVS